MKKTFLLILFCFLMFSCAKENLNSEDSFNDKSGVKPPPTFVINTSPLQNQCYYPQSDIQVDDIQIQLSSPLPYPAILNISLKMRSQGDSGPYTSVVNPWASLSVDAGVQSIYLDASCQLGYAYLPCSGITEVKEGDFKITLEGGYYPYNSNLPFNYVPYIQGIDYFEFTMTRFCMGTEIGGGNGPGGGGQL